jgi:adhesin transport system outer membrane protein
MMKRFIFLSFLSVFLPLLMVQSGLSQPYTVRDAAQKAVVDNPEVQVRWHNFLAAGHERDIVKGGYLPRVDVYAGAGRERYWQDRRDPSGQYYNRTDATISLTQMLYDGFATRNELRYMDHARLARYFELVSVSEDTALEAVRAYLDVVRYRTLTTLAEENYGIHKEIIGKVDQQVRAGVSRGVDLEQAGGRLALALANRMTEYSNLHDVSARFLRVVGEIPPPDLEVPPLMISGMSYDAYNAQVAGAQGNPGIRAAMANLEAMYARRDSRRSTYHPQLDFRARHSTGRERQAIRGRSDESVAELMLSLNLFNGGSDRAALAQAQQFVSRAAYERELACNNMRQTVAIAYNDIRNLGEALIYLDDHQLAMAKVRDAYRAQFNIGQRTLLDLLDAENEYFESRRAYVNARHDYALAHVRSHAATGQLLQALELQRVDLSKEVDFRLAVNQADPLTFCPPQVVADSVILPASYADEMITDSDGDSVMDAYDLCPDTPVGVKVDALGCPLSISMAAPGAVVEVLRSTLKINFAFDSAEIPAADVTEVSRIADFMKHYDNTKVMIEGHTDNIGSHAYNQRLSQARANAVRNRLVMVHGIDAERVRAIGYSFDHPLGTNDTAEGRALNRRVDAVSQIVFEAENATEDPFDFLDRWAMAWSAQDVNTYLSFYSQDFVPSGNMSLENWKTERHDRLTKVSSIEVSLKDFVVRPSFDHTVQVEVIQDYRSNIYSDRTNKLFYLQRSGDSWEILRERSLEIIR